MTLLRWRRLATLVLATLGAVAALSLTAYGAGTASKAVAKHLTPLTFQISWLPGGDNLEFWAGKAMGFYAKQGIDLTVVHTNDPTLSIKAAATGQVPIAVAYTGDIFVLAAKGLPVTSVFALTDRSPFGIISLASSNIHSPRDLVGKRVGVTSLPIDQAEFQTMLKTAGVDPSKVTVVDPGQGGAEQVIVGNLDATSAVADYEPSIFQSQGKKFNFLYYSQYGAPDNAFYNIVANPTWLKSHSGLMRRFIEATKQSMAWTSAHTAKAAAIFVKEFPGQPASLIATIWRRLSALEGSGANNPAQLQKLEAYLLAAKQLASPVKVKSIYSNAFL